MTNEKPIRVLYLTNGFALGRPLGGAERFTISLARALDRAKVEPILGGLWQWDVALENEWRSRLTAEGFSVLLGPPKDDANPYPNFVDSVRTLMRNVPGPVDIIHSECDFGDLVAVLLNLRLRARFLLRTSHNEREWPKRRWRRILFSNGLYPLVYDAELGVSKQVVENLDRRPLARLFRRKGIVAYNALDFSRFTEATGPIAAECRRNLGIPHGAFVVGTVGRLVRQKGLDVLLLAAKAVLVQRPAAYFIIVGSGELRESLEEKTCELGIADRVYFTGARPDVQEILPAMDLFASSSLWEGLPTVILEAMAAGVPVVATRVSGTVELVQDGRTGTLAPPGDSARLAGAILAVMECPEAAQAMAVRAREFALAHFDIRAVARQHEMLYRRLVQSS